MDILLPHLCWSCLRPGAPRWRGMARLCPPCLARLHLAMVQRAAPTPGSLQLTTIFRYQGIVRDWVLRAKVGGDQRALALIEEALATSPAAQRAIATCDVLMPCPSSLWGRWHGRLDISGCAATRLSVEARKPLATAPPSLFWRWRKQAHSHSDPPTAARDVWKGPRPAAANARWQKQMQRLKPLEPMRVLLVDDVATTGKTLDRLAAALSDQGYEACGALTFAAAPHFCSELTGP